MVEAWLLVGGDHAELALALERCGRAMERGPRHLSPAVARRSASGVAGLFVREAVLESY